MKSPTNTHMKILTKMIVIFVALFYDLELEFVKVEVTDGIESCVQ